MNKRITLGGGALLALALLFAGLTILFNQVLRGWRADLTQNHLYTLAPGTERILKGLREPINLYFFYSAEVAGQYPQVKAYASHVNDLLIELAGRSGGKLKLHVIDPQPFSEDEDRATDLGVKAVPIDAEKSFYLGLAGTNSTDGHAAIPFFDPTDPNKEQFLEYDVMKLVYQLSSAKKPVVGWLSSLQMNGGFDPSTGQQREPWIVLEQAQQLFTVRMLEESVTRIDPDVDVLVLVHPKQLSPATQFAIDQYALRGGRVLAFVDPVAEQDTSSANPQNPLAAMTADRSSHFEPLLGAWGVQFNPSQVIADAGKALLVPMRDSDTPVRHLGILGLDQSDMNRQDVITASLSKIDVASAGYLAPRKGSSVTFEPLLKSSKLAQPLPAGRFAMLIDPTTLMSGFHPTGQVYTIAARLTGNVKSAFPSGPPTGVQLGAGEHALASSAKPLNVIVVADTDMLRDYLWVREQNMLGQTLVQPFANNGDFVFNAIDNLAGSDDLISIRGRGSFARPFTRVEALRAQADERFHSKEQELESQLRDTEDKLTAMQSRRSDQTALILSPEQEQTIEGFQKEKLRIRKELREVRLGLDQNIHRLGNTLKIINIVVVPAAFALLALLIALRRRRRASAASAPGTQAASSGAPSGGRTGQLPGAPLPAAHEAGKP